MLPGSGLSRTRYTRSHKATTQSWHQSWLPRLGAGLAPPSSSLPGTSSFQNPACSQTFFTQVTLILQQALWAVVWFMEEKIGKDGCVSLSPALGPCGAKHPRVFSHRASWAPWEVGAAVIPVFRWESEAQRNVVTCLRSRHTECQSWDQNPLLDVRDDLLTPACISQA